MGGVVAVFDARFEFLAVFVVNLRFECGGLAIEKVRFQPFAALEKKKMRIFLKRRGAYSVLV